MCIYIYACVHAAVPMPMYTRIHVVRKTRVHIYIYIYIGVYTYVHVFIYIYIYANPPPLGPTFQGSKIPKFQKIRSFFWKFQNSKIPKFQSSKIPKFQNSKNPKFQKNPVNFLEFSKFPKGIDYWNSKKLTGFFWNFGILEF